MRGDEAGRAEGSTGGGELPFTGLGLLTLLSAGAVLLAVGATARHLTQRRR